MKEERQEGCNEDAITPPVAYIITWTACIFLALIPIKYEYIVLARTKDTVPKPASNEDPASQHISSSTCKDAPSPLSPNADVILGGLSPLLHPPDLRAGGRAGRPLLTPQSQVSMCLDRKFGFLESTGSGTPTNPNQPPSPVVEKLS